MACVRGKGVLTGLWAVSLVLLGCGPVDSSGTRFRRTAFVPTPAPSSLSQHVHGRVELQGMASMDFAKPKPHPDRGDPGLHTASVEFGALMRVAIIPYLSLGAQGVFAHSSMSQVMVEGTPPMPGERLYGGGPNLALHYGRHFGRKRTRAWGLGGGFALSYVSVPYAVWERNDSLTSADHSYDRATGPAYHLVQTGRENRWLYLAAVGGSVAFNPSFEIFLELAAQNALTNVGFDDQPRLRSTLRDVAGFVYTIGITYHGPGGLLIRAQYGLAFGSSRFYRYGVAPVFQLGLGMDLGRAPAGPSRAPASGANALSAP